jgi:MFS family permease
MLVGLVLLVAATLMLCLAKTMTIFMIGRILQGFSAALTWTVSFALVVDTVNPESTGKAMGWLGLATSIGNMSSPLLGGLVYGYGGYYAVFGMCFGLIFADACLRFIMIEPKEAKKWLKDTV